MSATSFTPGRCSLATALAFFLAFSITACDTVAPETTATPVAAETARGHDANQEVYVANLRPLNASVNGRGVTGKATFTLNGDQLTVMVNARGLATDSPLNIHPQHIHADAECPTMADDVNRDGFLDVIEGVPKYGPILLNLDGDLADTSPAPETFPSAVSVRGRSGYGMINYQQSASLSAIEAAIDEMLALETRTVVLHAVSADTPIPESVQSIGGLPQQLSLPVACGEIRRMR